MKNIIGFTIGDENTEEILVTGKGAFPEASEETPVRSLVTVTFPDVDRSYPYYNDRFSLQPGDCVYVSGKLAGRWGVVESVSTKFKISLADYEKVLRVFRPELHGTYEHLVDKMVCFTGECPDADTFRTWFIPPLADGEEPAEIVCGEGYSLDLDALEESDEILPQIAERALDYCRSGKVEVLTVKDGVGTAFVKGTKYYEVNFRIHGRSITDLYCDCPYPGFCKHSLAVLITLRRLLMEIPESLADSFTVIDERLFFSILRKTAVTVKV